MKRTISIAIVIVMTLCFSMIINGNQDAVVYAQDDHTHDDDDDHTHDDDEQDIDGFDVSLFYEDALAEDVTIQDCTLSDGTETTCYEITISGYPADYEVGPFCPETTSTSAEDAGIWFDGEAVYDVDGEFIISLAELYGDDNWLLYDEDGNVNITDTIEAFEAAARPDVDPEYQNHCVAGRIEWLENGEPVQTTVTIPTTPVNATNVGSENGNWGITLNGVVIANSAPVQAILGAYTIAVFDDCGGHINPFDGYHLHGAVGCSEVGETIDGETPIFAYALDGYAIHSPLSEEYEETIELDTCNGHYTEADGYHYHANSAEENSVLTCFTGLTAQATGQGDDDEHNDDVPQNGNGERPEQAQGGVDLASAAEILGITEAELLAALGDERPPNFEAAAEQLSISLEELQEALATP